MQMLLRISLSSLLLTFTAVQVPGSASSSASYTRSTALRNTLPLSLKQIHDALEPLQQMRDDLSILASRGFNDGSHTTGIGNELLHLLTDRKPHQLRVDLHDHEGHTASAKYEHFYVGPQTSKFALTVSGYSGTAGDSMAYHNNRQFSTKDQDNDNHVINCATRVTGAWWYKSCHHSNLNGLYAQTGSHNMTAYAKYVNWFHWRGHKYSLKFTEMKIRPEDH